MKHLAEYAAALAASGLVRFLPRSARLGFGRSLGSLLFVLDARHRRITFDNVSAAYGDEKSEAEKWAIAKGAFRHFGAMLIELTTLGRPSPSEMEALVEMEGVERYENARRRGKGVILVAAHFGNWELHAIAHGFRFGRFFLVAREQDNGYLNRWLERVRGISGNEVVYKQRALRQMRKLMKAGETVAFVIDQNVHLDDAVFVDFFGRKAATTPVASWFALRTGAALVPVFCYPTEDGRYRAVYEGPIDVASYAELEQAEALTRLTQVLAAVQERYIRRHPECWLWMHRRWRTRPPGEAAATEPDRPPGRDAVEAAEAAAEIR